MKKLLLLALMMLSFSAYSQTIHFMLFAATNDADLGTAAENVKKYFTYTFVPALRNNSGMSVSENYYCGSEFTKNKLESALSNLYSSSNDVIIFYFYGHGFNDCRPICPNPNNYPTVTLGTNSGPINPRMKSELDIFNTLKNKPHKLLITIAECCNRCMGGSCTPMSVIVPNPTVDLSPQKIRQLFSATGNYIVSSSSKGEYSFSGNMGFFTSAFKTAFEEELSSSNSGYPSWSNIFNNAASKTTATASKHEVDGTRCVQHPQWEKQPNAKKVENFTKDKFISMIDRFLNGKMYNGDKKDGLKDGYGIYKCEFYIFCGLWEGDDYIYGFNLGLKNNQICVGSFTKNNTYSGSEYDYNGKRTDSNAAQPLRIIQNNGYTYIGEVNSSNQYDGFGMLFQPDGNVWIGKWENGSKSNLGKLMKKNNNKL